MVLGTERDPFPDPDHRQIQDEPRHAAPQLAAPAERFAAPGLGKDAGNGHRHRDAPHQEARDAEERPVGPQTRRAAEGGSDMIGQRRRQTELPTHHDAGARAVGEPGEIAEADDRQRDDRGEQLHRHHGAQRAAVDLGEAVHDGDNGPQLTQLGQLPVAVFDALPHCGRICAVAHHPSYGPAHCARSTAASAQKRHSSSKNSRIPPPECRFTNR
ncbi:MULTISPECIES: hypothetical protein [unclassified Mycobacterium]|uniref:hypothetical protein n=1 Tax=unclassified Mycobacterium TaxID=2642494 RepID=UPI0032049D0D